MNFEHVKRPVAGTVLVAFLALVLQPLSVFAQDRPQSAASRRAADSGEEQFSRTLNEIDAILKEVAPQAAMPHMFRGGKPGEMELRAIGPNMRVEVERAKPLPGVDVAKKVSQLRDKAKALAALEQHVRAGFDDTARHIREQGLPDEILARHQEALMAYEARSAEFKSLVAAVERASGAGGAPLQAALNDLAAFMAKHPNQKTHTPTDPNQLPWASPKPATRQPYTRPSQFRTGLLFGEPVRVAQAGSLSGISLPGTVLPATPVPADTAPTEDVQITQPIRDLAASLGNSPVQIYNWVRNNIRFIPSYGSIQGSEMTLQTRRGNAFDTASLLIALLRAANIPARYVYGTIEVPAEKAMNWVGGATVPRAAINLIGQGGIPVAGITQSGQVRWVRMEHVWVEAFVDYVPSRGAVNRAPDTWVPLDASFKQYTFTQGMNIATNVPFNAEAFRTQVLAGATVNPGEGYVQNLSQPVIDQAISSYQTQVADYITSQNPNATPGDVLGTQTIVAEARPILLGTLPYKLVATGAKFNAMPDSLRWRFHYNLYASDFDRAMDSPFLAYSQSTPALAGKKLSLSFALASSADEATLRSFLPQPPPPGTPIPTSAIPASLPGYLIRLVPELRVDGQLVGSGPALTMGAELIQNAGLYNPAAGRLELAADNRPTVGDYTAVMVDLHGASERQLQAVQSRIQATRQAISQYQEDPGSEAAILALTKEELTGDLLWSALLSYFVAIHAAMGLGARDTGMLAYRMPSFGNFSIVAQARLSFGVPRSVAFPGFQMDIDQILGNEIAKDGNPATAVSFRRALGNQYSAHEHLVPEQMFTDPNDPNRPRGISAVSALAIATAQGQRIYTLNAQNSQIHAQVIAGLAIAPEVKQELGNALAAGREITVHQANINVSGFTGAGYVILDPDTGAAAYKISGGASGGYLSAVAMAAIALMIIALMAAKLIAAGLIGAFVLAAAPIYAAIFGVIAFALIIYLTVTDQFDRSCGSFSAACTTIDIITKIVVLTVAMALLAAGLAGNIIALALAILLLKQILTGRI